jgi:alkylation response protein AidB-like acyl-CoA dehydrogenase
VAREVTRTPEGPLDDDLMRDDIVRAAMQEQCFNLTVDRIEQGKRAGQAPGPDSSIIKVCGSELKQQRWETQMRIAGPEALGWEGDGYTERELAGTREWLRSRGNSIEGGTSEIQLNIIAKHVLGL